MSESTLGGLLRGAREARGLSVDDLSSLTRIRPRHLQALEEERLGELPAPVFVRGFIRAYCASVGAPPAEPLAIYEQHARTVTVSLVPLPTVPPAPERRLRTMVPVLIAVGLLLLGGALYLFASSSPPVRSPGPAALIPRP
jgi:cytoskeletal protein RodZ